MILGALMMRTLTLRLADSSAMVVVDKNDGTVKFSGEP
jgi:hypothetical protein